NCAHREQASCPLARLWAGTASQSAKEPRRGIEPKVQQEWGAGLVAQRQQPRPVEQIGRSFDAVSAAQLAGEGDLQARGGGRRFCVRGNKDQRVRRRGRKLRKVAGSD